MIEIMEMNYIRHIKQLKKERIFINKNQKLSYTNVTATKIN